MTPSLAVDLYPLALHVGVCDAAGRPGGRDRLVLTSHHVHVRDMLLEALDSSSLHGLSRGLSLNAVPSMQEEVMMAFVRVAVIRDKSKVAAFRLEKQSCSVRRKTEHRYVYQSIGRTRALQAVR